VGKESKDPCGEVDAGEAKKDNGSWTRAREWVERLKLSGAGH
jgi:hypothetical protein